MTDPQRDAGLDALRAAATLMVLFAHGGYFLFAAVPHYDAFALASWIGTDVFFALSGYLVTRSLLATPSEGPGSALGFVARRLWRILPLYWLFLALNVWLAHAAGRALPPDLGDYALLAQNLAWPHPAFFGEAWNLPLLLLFSLSAPGMVLAGSRAHRLRIATIGFALLVAIGIALRAVWVLEADPSWDEGVRKIVIVRLDACAWGALAACVAASRAMGTRDRRVAWGVALGALLVAIALFAAGARDVGNGARIATFAFSCAAAAAACLACTDAIEPGRSRTGTATLALSRWSFALYLTNMPMLWVLEAVGWGQPSGVGDGVLRFVAWFALTLAAGAFVHRWIERPLLARLPRRA